MPSNKYYRFSSRKSSEKFINEGLLYFNSLMYYKEYPSENDAIKDEKEGVLVCSIPSSDVKIILDGITIKNDEIVSPYVNIDTIIKEPENIFIYCLSNAYDEIMYEKFQADSCVQINDIDEFTKRIQAVLPSNYMLHFNNVEYYNPKEQTQTNKPLCLYKRKEYEYQQESRFYLHIPYLNKKSKSNFENNGQFENLKMHLKLQSLELRIGNIEDISKLIIKR